MFYKYRLEITPALLDIILGLPGFKIPSFIIPQALIPQYLAEVHSVHFTNHNTQTPGADIMRNKFVWS